jgi:hypothetical protein
MHEQDFALESLVVRAREIASLLPPGAAVGTLLNALNAEGTRLDAAIAGAEGGADLPLLIAAAVARARRNRIRGEDATYWIGKAINHIDQYVRTAVE